MTTLAHTSNTDWIAAVHQVLAPHLHQIPYGNLREETSQWDEAEGQVTNMAIVYEVPGGSTNQINITHTTTGDFLYLGLDSHEECCTTTLSEVLAMVEAAITRIPAIRQQRLLEDIDRWAQQGMTQKDLFQKITKLLQIEDLRGGTITMQEMKSGITYILAHYRVPG